MEKKHFKSLSNQHLDIIYILLIHSTSLPARKQLLPRPPDILQLTTYLQSGQSYVGPSRPAWCLLRSLLDICVNTNQLYFLYDSISYLCVIFLQMIMDFRRLEMLVNFRCFDLTGNDRTQTHLNVIDMFFYFYIYIIYFILLLKVGKCSKIYLFGFVLLKWPILAADSAVKAGTQLIKMAENVLARDFTTKILWFCQIYTKVMRVCAQLIQDSTSMCFLLKV